MLVFFRLTMPMPASEALIVQRVWVQSREYPEFPIQCIRYGVEAVGSRPHVALLIPVPPTYRDQQELMDYTIQLKLYGMTDGVVGLIGQEPFRKHLVPMADGEQKVFLSRETLGGLPSEVWTFPGSPTFEDVHDAIKNSTPVMDRLGMETPYASADEDSDVRPRRPTTQPPPPPESPVLNQLVTVVNRLVDRVERMETVAVGAVDLTKPDDALGDMSASDLEALRRELRAPNGVQRVAAESPAVLEIGLPAVRQSEATATALILARVVERLEALETPEGSSGGGRIGRGFLAPERLRDSFLKSPGAKMDRVIKVVTDENFGSIVGPSEAEQVMAYFKRCVPIRNSPTLMQISTLLNAIHRALEEQNIPLARGRIASGYQMLEVLATGQEEVTREFAWATTHLPPVRAGDFAAPDGPGRSLKNVRLVEPAIQEGFRNLIEDRDKIDSLAKQKETPEEKKERERKAADGKAAREEKEKARKAAEAAAAKKQP